MELLCYLALCGYGFLNIHFLVLQPLRFYCVIHFDQGPRTINVQLS